LDSIKIPADPDAQFQRLRNGKQGIKELLTAFKVHGIPEIVIDLLSGMLNVDPNQRFNIHQVLQHPWLQPPSSLSPSSTASLEPKSTPSSNDNVNVDVQTTIPKIPKEITIVEETKDEYPSSSQFNLDQKVISPPLDDSWSTHHRLIDQFEEKYGKLIAQQEKQHDQSGTSSKQFQYPSYSFQPTEYNPSSYFSDHSYNPKIHTPFSNPSIHTSRKPTNQVGWKRKKNDMEPDRRVLPPRLSLNNP